MRSPALVQAAERHDCLVEGLAGDEPRGAEPHPVPRDERAGRAGCPQPRGSAAERYAAGSPIELGVELRPLGGQ